MPIRVGGLAGSRFRGRRFSKPIPPPQSVADVVGLIATPTSASIAPGGNTPITVSPRNFLGQEIPGLAVTWTASPSGVLQLVDPNAADYATTAFAVGSGGAGLVTASVPGPGGSTISVSIAVTVANTAPTAVIRAPLDGFIVPINTPITFDPTGTTDAQGSWQGTWTFGDGQSLTGTMGVFASHIVQHSYAAAGPVTVTWSVVDQQGLTTVIQITGTVTTTPRPVVAVAILPSSAILNKGGHVILQAIALDAQAQVIPGKTATWASDTPGVATVSPASGASTTATASSSTTGTAGIVATIDGIASAACAITVIATPSGLYPNRPPSLVQALYQYDGNGVPGPGWTPINMVVGKAQSQANMPGSFVAGNAPGVDVDPSTVLDILFQTALGSGTSPIGMWMWTDSAGPEVRELYDSNRFVFNPGGASTWENPGAGPWKPLGYYGVGYAPGTASSEIYVSMQALNSSGSTAAGLLVTGYTLQVRQQGPGGTKGRDMEQNAGNFTFVMGKEYHVEVYMKLNTPGVFDGVLKVWATNITDSGPPILILDYAVPTATPPANPADRQSPMWCSLANPHGFSKRSYVPVWGGSAPAPKTRTDTLRIIQMAGWGAT